MKYSIIIIPILNTQELLQKDNLRASVKKVLQAQQHGRFVMRLKEKGEVMGVTVKIVSEYLTSQMCGKCFNKHKTSEKQYNCPVCEIKIDRDINGARNINIKELASIIEKYFFLRAFQITNDK